MLTNFQTVHQRLQRLQELELLDFDDVAGSGKTKKELLQLKREKDKLAKTLGGIRDMGRTPAAVWIVDTKKEHLAVDECKKLGIPIVGILDTNCDPDEVDYAIPGNDDAIRSVTLLTRVVADAVAEGLMARAGVRAGNEPTGAELGAEEPLAEWERELLQGSADAPPASTPAASGGDPTAAAAATSAIADASPAASRPETAAAAEPAATAQPAPTTEPASPEPVAATEPTTPEAPTSETVTTEPVTTEPVASDPVAPEAVTATEPTAVETPAAATGSRPVGTDVVALPEPEPQPQATAEPVAQQDAGTGEEPA
jgi:small subunit ribosomal protein S2